MSDVLTKSGPYRSYASKLAAYFNIDTKQLTWKVVDIAYKKFEPTIKYKMEHGWVKDHVRADIEAFEFIEKIMRHPLNQAPNLNGWKDENDPINRRLKKMVLMVACIRDEDSFYDMLMLVMDKWKHENWKRYERSAEQAYQLINFPLMYAHLLHHSEAIEEPLPDITDEPDVERVDFIALEKRLTNGMGNKGKRARESVS